MQASPGAKFRQALKEESPLQVIGAICAYHALLAKRSGYRAIYLSGGGVAAGSLGLPDLGISNLDDVLTDIRRITDVCDLPLLVDVDTGFGASAFNVARTPGDQSESERLHHRLQRQRSGRHRLRTSDSERWSHRALSAGWRHDPVRLQGRGSSGPT